VCASNYVPLPPIGFRLLHELEGLIVGVQADGVITPAEVSRLGRWLAENELYASIHPFSELKTHLEQVLADRAITTDECEDLLFAIRKLTRSNPYFDALRTGLQVLMGLLAGVSADKQLGDAELRAISDWAEESNHLQGLWPFDECCTVAIAIRAAGRADERKQYLFDLARQFPVAGDLDEETGELPPLLVNGVCAIDPQIIFQDSRFVFTGESRRATRSALETLVAERGGEPWPRVTADAHYLVVCDGGNPLWAFSCYGRKVEQAYKLRKKGHRIMIVHEADFWDAVADTGATV